MRTLSRRLAARVARLAAASALAATGLAGLPMLVGSAHAATTTINCDTARGTDWTTCRQLVPTASCAFHNDDGTWTMALGYRNPTGDVLTAATAADGGTRNRLSADGGTAGDPGQPSTFEPGTSVTAFTVTWTPAGRRGDDISWNLMGHDYSWTTTRVPACATRPVPIMGNMTAVGLTLGLLVGGFALVNRRRLARLRTAPWLHRAS